MNIIIRNYETAKLRYHKGLMLNLVDKINLKRTDKYVALCNLNTYDIWKNIKSHIKTINLTYQVSIE